EKISGARTMKTPKANALPVSFDQFRKNPVAAVAFCMLAAVSYLYWDVKSGYEEQIQQARKEIAVLNTKVDRMNYALKRSDSALAAAITELRLINAMKKM
ncbi:MAG: hypothetical protein ACO3IT_07965, partial [Ilumatobacteraceae bacterium]